MRRSPSAEKLVKATPLLALAVPFVVFGFLYVLLVQPERGVPARASTSEQPTAAVRSTGVAETIRSLANSPAVGGVKNLSVVSGASDESGGPVTVAFDAEYAQIGRFLSNLRSLPAAFDVRSFEIEPANSATPGLMSARIILFMLKSGAVPAPPAPVAAPVVQRVAAPRRPSKVITPEPFVPDPVVNGILFSASRQLAVLDGHVVKPGDRVGPLFVRAIERDGVILTTASGLKRRVALDRPGINGTAAAAAPY
jgi:hypothetical protein